MTLVQTVAPAANLGRQVNPPGDGGGLIPPSGGWGGLSGPYVWDAESALRIPAVGRSVQLYTGMLKQMPMDAYRGWQQMPTPRLLSAPDPFNGGPWFVEANVQDYLLNGNAVCLVTVRGADGWPLAVQWLPARGVYITWWPPNPQSVMYTYNGQILNPDDVIHVKRGADRFYPVRGVGVILQHLATLDRVAMQEEYERATLAGSAVPSVAIITPQASLMQDVADEAKIAWQAKFSGPVREPAILPNGTQVIPLGWSPSDAQLTQARQLSLVDVANMFNLDGYWLGAPVAGMTYRTAGPQYQQILRTSLEPVIADFEAAWSAAWLPRGTEVRFRRSVLLRDDLATTTASSVALYQAGIITQPEAREAMGLAPAGGPDAPPPGTAPPGLPSPADPNEPADTSTGPDDTAGGGTP